jgi:uncharacterized membrane protein
MLIARYFTEFIFYSFLGWVWESIYCTIKEKEWQDRGFLFGPICPIYGASVVAATILFRVIPHLRGGNLPVWVIFLICMVGSAIAEYGTSWFLEWRFHMRWWDYSHTPLNLNGRICLPASVGFGVGGVVIVRYLLPAMNGMHAIFSPLVYEGLALGLAIGFGADLALTEASLSSLISRMQDFKEEFNIRAELAYDSVTRAPELVNENLEKVKGRAESYVSRMSGLQKHILKIVVEFQPVGKVKVPEIPIVISLKAAVRRLEGAGPEKGKKGSNRKKVE